MDIPTPPIICFQFGTDQNPCHCKVVGPTLSFLTTVFCGVSVQDQGAEAHVSDGILDLLLACVSALLLLR